MATQAQLDRGTLLGRVESKSGEPIPYASIAVYNKTDSLLIGGGASDEGGYFNVDLPAGNYYALISFLSFESLLVPEINITAETPVDIGKKTLTPNALALQEIEIISEKSTMELLLDKRVFNVGKDLSGAGLSAAEILQNVPSVEVGVEGNVSLRGSENVRILIDGKPSSLTGAGNAEALRMLQGSMIEKVEVITNPSSRYEAEGEAGIINIVLKQEQQKGINGAFELSTGFPTNHGFTYSINLRRKKFNLFSSYGINLRNTPGIGESTQRYDSPDTSYLFRSEYTRYRGGLSNVGRLGADIYINSKNTLTVSAMGRTSAAENPTDLIYTDLSGNENVIATTRRYDVQTDRTYDLEGNLNYKKTFERKGREWNSAIRLSRNYDSETSRIDQTSDYSPEDGILQRSYNTENQDNILLQTDYIHPMGMHGKWETGLRYSSRKIQNDFRVESGTEDFLEVLPDFTNKLAFVENIGAAYAMYSGKKGRLNYQGGLRIEYTYISTKLTDTSPYVREYTTPFPSVHISYELNKTNTLQFSFSQRISRPRYRELIPFYMFSDPRNFFSGNPNLDPEFSDSYEAGYLSQFDKGTILLSLYYRHATGVTERIITTDSSGLIRRFPVNLSTRDAYGLELTSNYDINKWMRFNGSVNLYRAITVGYYQGRRLFSDTYTAHGRASLNFKLPKNANAQISWMYRAPMITPQGRMAHMHGGDLGLNRDFFKGKGTLTIAVRDILNSRKMRGTMSTQYLISESMMQWQVRQITATFTYRINQKKETRQRNGQSQSVEGEFDM